MLKTPDIMGDDFKNKLKRKAREQRTQEFNDLIKMALDKFKQNLENGTVEIKSVSDLEKLVKLKLLIEGEPTDIVETKADVEVSSPKIVEDLREEMGEDFDKLKEMLYKKMNERNDKGERD